MRTAWALLLFAVGAAAQIAPETETARARRLLSSPQWHDKAWGAYFAGGLHAEELKEPLIEAFREAAQLRDARPPSEEYGYLAALFDAAIQSGMTVPVEMLQPFEAQWRAAVIILLAHDLQSEESLLRMREEKLTDAEWLAVSNVLAERKSQSFFAKTLSELEISHQFILNDPDSYSGVGGGVYDGGCGDGILAMPKGFPPTGVYELVNSGHAGDALIADGPRAAYYRRVVVPTDKQAGIGVCGGLIERQKIRIGYLAPLNYLSEPQAQALFHASTQIQFQSDAILQQRWDAALAAQEFQIRDFVRKAQDRGLGNVKGMKLKIVPKLDDLRKITAGPVPSLTPREFVLD